MESSEKLFNKLINEILKLRRDKININRIILSPDFYMILLADYYWSLFGTISEPTKICGIPFVVEREQKENFKILYRKKYKLLI